MFFRVLIVCFLLIPSFVFAKLTHESELAIVQSGGNSELQTTNGKTTNVYDWSLNKILFGGHYTYGETDNGVSARNWDANTKYERQLSDHVSTTLGEVIEGNKFIGIKTRYNSDLGFKYYSIKTDSKILFSELGYRYTIEDRYSPEENAYDNKARLYNEFSHKISETVQYKLWLELIPNFTDSRDYIVNGEASITSILSSIFSLKVAYMGMYDNRPAQSGFKTYDYRTTTSLVAKF